MLESKFRVPHHVGSGGDTKQSRRPTEQYSMLVQVGGRNSFVDDPIPRQLVIEENAYAQLHESKFTNQVYESSNVLLIIIINNCCSFTLT